MNHRNLSPLFEGHLLRAIVEAACEARLGSVAADDPDAPSVARLSLGCYAVVGGDPGHPLARRLVETVERPREIVYGNDPAWRRLILDVHGSRVVDRPMRIFDPSGLDRATLLCYEATVPPELVLRPIDVGLARQLDAELEPHGLQVFPSAEAMVRDGLGYGIVAGDGTLACAATSYTLSSRNLEVAIATRPAFRGQGLAMAASAALIRHALDAGLVPQWSASNPVSQRLAQRLGFAPAGECEVLLLG